MKRRILTLALLTLLLLTGWAQALSPSLEEAAPEAASLANGSPEDGFGLFSGMRSLLRTSLEELQEYMFSGIKSIAAIMAGVILLGVVESAAPAGKEVLSKYVSIAGALPETCRR